MLWQLVLDEFSVGEITDAPSAVHQNDLFKSFVSLWILNDAHERRKSSAGGKKVQAQSWPKVVDHERTDRLAADDDFIARL
ncbi:hypothetical protein GALL_447940 [mine drainage metagenome]|uniref:Uncharacterized protein n=1 Tax=mine drainage metagenome TaxID=410659 RepID=A0A1J5QC78_9ZZZZ